MYGGYLSTCRLRSLPRRASSPAPSSTPNASETRHADKDIPTRAAQKTATTTTTDTIASSAAIIRNAFLLSVLFIYPPDAQNRPVQAFPSVFRLTSNPDKISLHRPIRHRIHIRGITLKGVSSPASQAGPAPRASVVCSRPAAVVAPTHVPGDLSVGRLAPRQVFLPLRLREKLHVRTYVVPYCIRMLTYGRAYTPVAVPRGIHPCGGLYLLITPSLRHSFPPCIA